MMSLQLATVPCSCRGDGERSVADSAQTCVWTIKCRVDDDRRRSRLGILASWLKGVSHVGRDQSTGALVHHDGELEGYLLLT